MSKSTILFLHLLANILAQGAIIALIPAGQPIKYYQAIVAIIGVIVAFYDTASGKSVSAPVASSEVKSN